MSNTQTFSQLKKEQKQAIGLLSIGTFLEYFDLMLYVHMAVLLNELFFPKTDPHITKLLGAFAFCSTYLLRPFGALIFGWIGDTIGRKNTIVITTFLMSLSCIMMANLPTYDQIGITATYIVTACRMLQGISSMGEIVGAELYLTEAIKPPTQYPIVMLVAICSILGTTFALGIASLVTSFGFNWRIAFWIGAAIAMISAVARTTLRETPEFANAQRRIKRAFNKINVSTTLLENSSIYQEKVNKVTMLSLFLIQCGWPICFYFTYIYCGNLLQTLFNYSAEQVIHQNFIVSMINLLGYIILTYLCCVIHPLKILSIKLLIFCPVILIIPYLLNNINCPIQLFLIQSFVMLFVLSTNPATSVLYSHIPIFKRFTTGSLLYALSRVLMHIITSLGIVYLTKYFGNIGLLIIMIPMCIGFTFGIHHFKQLEIKAGRYYINNLPNHHLIQ